MDKTKFKDEKGRYIVQGLFLEDRYNTDLAVFTLDGEDKTYKGKIYPSLKKLYLEEKDPVEYLFATKHLYDWNHWKRLCKNVIVGRHIEEWREELELFLRSEAVEAMIDLSLNQDHYQATKFLQDKGWDVHKRGRPSKEEIQREVEQQAQEEKIWGDDVALLETHRKKK